MATRRSLGSMTIDRGTSKARQIGLLMTLADEATLSTRLVELAPSTVFIDGARWPSVEPPLRNSIASCEDREVYVWNRSCAAPADRSASRWRCPGADVWSGDPVRPSLLDGEELLSGRIAAGFPADDEDRAVYVERVWKLVKSITAPVEGLTGVRFDHRLGFDAMRWYLDAPGPKWTGSNQGHRLRDRAVLSLYLRPCHTAR